MAAPTTPPEPFQTTLVSRRRLLWKLFSLFMCVAVAGIAAVSIYAARVLRIQYIEHVSDELRSRAMLVKPEVQNLLVRGNDSGIDSFCKVNGKAGRTRITIIAPDGIVLGDSNEQPAGMDNHADRPEVKEALAGAVGTSLRPSSTLKTDLLYVAVPVEAEGRLLGVVRTAVTLSSVNQALSEFYVNVAIAGVVVVLAVAGLSLLLSRSISQPLEEIRACADRISAGDLSCACKVPDTEEFAGVAISLNRMARQLDERFRTLLSQRNELEAVLSSMVEGVLVVDAHEKVLRMNEAAAGFLRIDAREAIGRSIQEVVRHADMQRFLARAFESKATVEDEIVLQDEGERCLQAHGTVLRDARGAGIGVLLVLNDVTRMRRLESVRRDFVANVSHELKTPITSIKGFVETLLDGAMSDPREAENFLRIIQRQADRLNAIIEDLLTLSKVEQGEEQESIVLEEAALREVLQTAIQACEVKAQDKRVRIELACLDGLRARINPPLLEQALVNLIDNAIKYSEPGSQVEVLTAQRNGEIALSVRDHGPGIEQEHLTRIFERFYRVDKARSRKLGGTGLGLAIVKHIAQAHKGRVAVESSPGKGSTFTIYI